MHDIYGIARGVDLNDFNKEDELYHYGVLGQRWGVRRYQNKDGSLTKAGMKKYRNEIKEENKKLFSTVEMLL